ncbi:hypothetical protein ABK040_000131 [Willaertia magna]
MSPSVCHNFNTATCCNNNTCNNNNHSTIAPTIVLVDNSLDFSGITKQKKTKKNSTKHKRNKIACKGCRQAKKRCSHERPCSRCTKLGVECVDLETGKKRGRPPKKSLLKEDISSSNSDNASSTTNSFQPDNLIPNNSNNMPQLKSNHNSNIKKEVEYVPQYSPNLQYYNYPYNLNNNSNSNILQDDHSNSMIYNSHFSNPNNTNSLIPPNCIQNNSNYYNNNSVVLIPPQQPGISRYYSQNNLMSPPHMNFGLYVQNSPVTQPQLTTNTTGNTTFSLPSFKDLVSNLLK